MCCIAHSGRNGGIARAAMQERAAPRVSTKEQIVIEVKHGEYFRVDAWSDPAQVRAIDTHRNDC
jgi:hypothetical protein